MEGIGRQTRNQDGSRSTVPCQRDGTSPGARRSSGMSHALGPVETKASTRGGDRCLDVRSPALCRADQAVDDLPARGVVFSEPGRGGENDLDVGLLLEVDGLFRLEDPVLVSGLDGAHRRASPRLPRAANSSPMDSTLTRLPVLPYRREPDVARVGHRAWSGSVTPECPALP